MRALAQRLHDRFPQAEPARIDQVLDEVHHQYDGRPIREFIPVLVEREVADRIRDPAFA